MASGVQTAMVLAAGRGERMRPLSDVLPKPALPLPGGPVVAWPLCLAAALTEQRLVVNSWHLATHMECALGRVELPGVELAVSRETTLMGTAGGLALARDRGLLTGDPVLVLNGDVVLDLDLQPLLERHRSSDDLVTLALLPHPDPLAWSRVITDGQGRVRGFLPRGAPRPGEKPFLYPGAMLVSESLLAGLPSGPGDTLPLLWKPALQQQRLGGAIVGGSWREVGTPAAYLDAVLELLARISHQPSTAVGDAPHPAAFSRLGMFDVLSSTPAHPSGRKHRCAQHLADLATKPGEIFGLADRVELAADAMVAAAASLESVLVGPGSRIEAGAEVSESVISHGAVVRAGARVHRSVLLGPVEAAPDEELSNEHRTAPLPD